MNRYTREIAALLGVSLEYARRVQDAMELSGLDFSECTQREFNRAAREAFAAMEGQSCAC